MGETSIGMVGLGVMGRNLVLNIEEKGFSASAYDAWPDPVDSFVAETKGKRIEGFHDLKSFVASLSKPRKIILLVKAGDVTDKTIAALRPLLEKDDLIVDGGNAYYKDTERRAAALEADGIRYFGMGVSGGERGARLGPSMMPGGDRLAYDELSPILTKIAAQHPDGPCVTYIGPGGSGHYVKMVHNGIEYGDMQLIAEAYDALKTLGGLSNAELGDVFEEWNRGELESYLIEISAKIFRTKDPLGGGDLVDQILDETGMKGTGKWTVQEAAEIGSPVTTIATSVEARQISARKQLRLKAEGLLPGPKAAPIAAAEKKALIADVRAALYAAKTMSYAQGMSMLHAASVERSWGLDLGEIARIWQAGCIIRAKFLSRIKDAYAKNPGLEDLLFDPSFIAELTPRQDAWRRLVGMATHSGVPLLGMSASLGYYDMIRRGHLPANLTQAQRDFFGAHTYKRLDREGTFHTDWEAP